MDAGLKSFFKFGTNITFCNILDKFVGQKNPIIFPPKNVWFWGSKSIFWTNNPLISFRIGGQNFQKMLSLFVGFQYVHMVQYYFLSRIMCFGQFQYVALARFHICLVRYSSILSKLTQNLLGVFFIEIRITRVSVLRAFSYSIVMLIDISIPQISNREVVWDFPVSESQLPDAYNNRPCVKAPHKAPKVWLVNPYP